MVENTCIALIACFLKLNESKYDALVKLSWLTETSFYE